MKKDLSHGLASVFSNNVLQTRKLKGLTQAGLAHKANVTVETVARIERVVRARSSANINPSLSTIANLAQALGVPPSQLLATPLTPISRTATGKHGNHREGLAGSKSRATGRKSH